MSHLVQVLGPQSDDLSPQGLGLLDVDTEGAAGEDGLVLVPDDRHTYKSDCLLGRVTRVVGHYPNLEQSMFFLKPESAKSQDIEERLTKRHVFGIFYMGMITLYVEC